MKGTFITFEGPEGSGKSTILKAVEKKLIKKGYDILTTREPGGIQISEKIRSVILDVHHTEMDAKTEALLYAASRRQHLIEKIWPALKQGKVVLCDRFIDSSLAYQGHGRNLGIDEVFKINQFAIENKMPDLTIFIDVPPQIGLNRVFDNHRSVDRLDLESVEFHQTVYEGYLKLLDKFPDRIKVIDGNKDVESVTTQALTLVERFLSNK